MVKSSPDVDATIPQIDNETSHGKQLHSYVSDRRGGRMGSFKTANPISDSRAYLRS
jgi:hypothetical protein